MFVGNEQTPELARRTPTEGKTSLLHQVKTLTFFVFQKLFSINFFFFFKLFVFLNELGQTVSEVLTKFIGSWNLPDLDSRK